MRDAHLVYSKAKMMEDDLSNPSPKRLRWRRMIEEGPTKAAEGKYKFVEDLSTNEAENKPELNDASKLLE